MGATVTAQIAEPAAVTPSPKKGGVVTWACAPGFPPAVIFPFTPAERMGTRNILEFQALMYRTLYFFGSDALVGIGVAVYGLPLGPAVIVGGTLIWTLAEIIGVPAAFSYPAIAGPVHLKGRYIGSFQFMFGLGAAVGPMLGGVLFARLGHAVWPVMALVAAASIVLGVAGIRTPEKEPAGAAETQPSPAADLAAVT